MSDPELAAAPELRGLTVLRLLGSGGFAKVYLYQQERPRMQVAVKVLSGEGLSDEARERFAAEANAMAMLDHPYIVQVFNADVTADGRPYMVMKYYPQPNLGSRSRAEQIPVHEVLQIGVRIASAVETAHRAGVLHRDIKPANILTSQFGDPGLTDFGIATTIGVESTSESEGLSIPWSPPEVIFGESAGDQRADVYSLAATLWQLLTGRSPFHVSGGDNSQVALIRRIKDAPPPRTGRADVPPSLERVLAQAMAKSPAQRPESAAAFARLLQSVETEQRWAPTPLVIDGAAVEAPSRQIPAAASVEDELATRRRATGVVAQPTPDAGLVDTVEDQDLSSPTVNRPGARVRVGIPPDIAPDATVRRVAGPAAVLPPAEASKPRRGVLAVAAVVLFGAAIGIGVAVAGHGGHNPTTSSTTSTLAGPAPTIASPAAEPVVSAARASAAEVVYSWTDPGAQSGDEFLYSVDGGAYRSAGARRQIELSVPKGSSKCLTVEIDRSGLAGSPSAATCNEG